MIQNQTVPRQQRIFLILLRRRGALLLAYLVVGTFARTPAGLGGTSRENIQIGRTTFCKINEDATTKHQIPP